jgi:hypothetical protein
VNCRSSVKNYQKTPKPAGFVTPGSVWTIPAFPRAIRTTLGAGVRHRDSQYLNNVGCAARVHPLDAAAISKLEMESPETTS